MSSLNLVAIGFLVVTFDLRVSGVDIATDGFGWGLALLGLALVARMHRGFAVAALAAAGGLVSWAAHPWLGVTQGSAEVAELVAQTVLVFATCTALMDLVPEKRRSAEKIRWADFGISLVGLLGVAAISAGAPDDVDGLALLVIPLVLFALFVLACFIVLLFRCARTAPPLVSHPVG